MREERLLQVRGGCFSEGKEDILTGDFLEQGKEGNLEKEARAVNCGGTGRIQQGGFWGSRGLSGELF